MSFLVVLRTIIEGLSVFCIGVDNEVVDLCAQECLTCIVVALVLLSEHQVLFPAIDALVQSHPLKEHLNEYHNMSYDYFEDDGRPPEELLISGPLVSRHKHERDQEQATQKGFC